MADQLNAVKDEFEKYKRNSVALAGYESDEVEELTLPEVAPELYNPFNTEEDAIQFLRRVWWKYLDAGILYQDDLRSSKKGKDGGLDPRLMSAIARYCKDKEIPTNSIVSKKSDRTDREIEGRDVKSLSHKLQCLYYRRIAKKKKLNNPT